MEDLKATIDNDDLPVTKDSILVLIGTVILHVSPEANDGGLPALVETGDRIRFSASRGQLELLVSEAEIERTPAHGRCDLVSRLQSQQNDDRANDSRRWRRRHHGIDHDTEIRGLGGR